MKKIILIITFVLAPILSAFASDEPSYHLTTVNAEVAKAAFASYSEGHYRYIQNGKLIEAYDVDQEKPSCVLESGKMAFNSETTYALQSSRSLDVDGEAGEIELTFETQSSDSESYFQIYCFQSTPGATLETARAGLKSVFEIE